MNGKTGIRSRLLLRNKVLATKASGHKIFSVSHYGAGFVAEIPNTISGCPVLAVGQIEINFSNK
ncbi:hypothetical protein BH11BAC1_BH11BAC1_26190 [soil metagenome]